MGLRKFSAPSNICFLCRWSCLYCCCCLCCCCLPPPETCILCYTKQTISCYSHCTVGLYVSDHTHTYSCLINGLGEVNEWRETTAAVLTGKTHIHAVLKLFHTPSPFTWLRNFSRGQASWVKSLKLLRLPTPVLDLENFQPLSFPIRNNILSSLDAVCWVGHRNFSRGIPS